MAAILVIGVLSAGLAFHGWPALPAPGERSPELLALPPDRALTGAGVVHGAAPAEVLPVIAHTKRRVPAITRAHRALPRRAATRGVAERAAGRLPSAARPPVTPLPAAGVSPPSGGGAPPAADPTPSSSGPSRGAANPAAGGHDRPAGGPRPSGGGRRPSPVVPETSVTPPVTPTVPSPARVVDDVTQAAGGPVQQGPQTAADAVRPVSPTVSQAGDTAATTVRQTGQAVGGVLAGVLGAR